MTSETAGELKLNRPLLVAVWPGMGQFALSAGYYLLAILQRGFPRRRCPR